MYMKDLNEHFYLLNSLVNIYVTKQILYNIILLMICEGL